MSVFYETGKPEYPEKNLSEHGVESNNRSRATLVEVSTLTTAATLLPLTSPCGCLQAKLIKEEFDVHSGGPSRAY